MRKPLQWQVVRGAEENIKQAMGQSMPFWATRTGIPIADCSVIWRRSRHMADKSLTEEKWLWLSSREAFRVGVAQPM